MDYFFWNWDPVLFKLGNLVFTWYAFYAILSFVLSVYFIRKLFTKKDVHIYRIDLFIIFITVISLIFARIGSVLANPIVDKNESFLSYVLPLSFNPAIHFVGLHHLSLPFGILGLLFASWSYNKIVRGGPVFRIWDAVAILACLVGALFFKADFLHSTYLGTPSGGPDGTVSIRPVYDGLKKLSCCIMRNPDGPNPLTKILIKKGNQRMNKEPNLKNMDFLIDFKPGIEEREASEFVIGDIKTYLYEHPVYVSESGKEPINYSLTKLPAGHIQGKITTLGIARHPVAAYLTLFLFLMAVFFYFFERKNRAPGFITAWILILFSVFYFLIQFITLQPTQEKTMAGLWTSQWCILPVFLFGWIIYFSKAKKA